MGNTDCHQRLVINASFNQYSQSVFGSDRSSSSANVCPFSSNLSRAVNLHLSRSESKQSTQGAFTSIYHQLLLRVASCGLRLWVVGTHFDCSSGCLNVSGILYKSLILLSSHIGLFRHSDIHCNSQNGSSQPTTARCNHTRW